MIPGMEEVVSLLHIRREAREGNFDVGDCRRRADRRDRTLADHAGNVSSCTPSGSSTASRH